MPPSLYCLVFGEVITVACFLSGLATTVSTGTRLVLWNLEKLPIPVEPLGIEVGNLPRPQSEPTCYQTDEPRLEITGTG
jgi:hypothetical protein